MPELETVDEWAGGIEGVGKPDQGMLERAEPRQWAITYLRGLMSDTSHKNGWHLSEQADELTPDGMQWLLSTAAWDVEGVRDDLRA